MSQTANRFGRAVEILLVEFHHVLHHVDSGMGAMAFLRARFNMPARCMRTSPR